MITIKDLAKKANVSVATVSYALNDKPGISAQKKKEILKLAHDYGYVPNSVAKSLQSKSTNVIGVVIPELSNTYNSELLLNLENEARLNNYYLLLGSTHNDLDIGKEVINKFIEKNIDAIIIVVGQYTSEEYYKPIVNRFNQLDIPVVFIGAAFKELAANFISLDLQTAMRNITERLLQKLKEANLVFFGGSMDEHYTKLRVQGIKESFQSKGYTFKAHHHFNIGKQYSYESGYKAIKAYISSHDSVPGAILAINDMVAYGIMKGLNEHGLKVPENVYLTGCDKIFIPGLNDISLTTIQIPINKISTKAFNIILNSKNDPGITQKNIELPLDLYYGDTA